MSTLNAKVDNALKATEEFSALLDKETAALRASDFNAFAAMQDQKIELAQRYQDSIMDFEQDVDFLKSLDEKLKDKLRAAHQRFRAAADTNDSVLASSVKVAGRIVSMIMDAAKRGVQEAPNYGATAMQTVSHKIPLNFKINDVL